MGLPESIAKGIANAANPIYRCDNIRPGRYIFAVAKIEGKSGFKGNRFLAEFVTKQAVKTIEGIEPNAVGSRTKIIEMLDNNTYALGRVKAFVLALTGTQEHETTTEEIMATLNELMEKDQPGRGMLIACDAQPSQKCDDRGVPYVNNRWQNVVQDSALVTASRAELDKLGIG